MTAKVILVLCAQALLVKSVFSQCIGAGLAPAALAYDGLALGAGCAQFMPTASVGGSFVVTSSSPVPPIGVTVVSDNVYEGILAAGGDLPLLGSVGLEGEVVTAGAGTVSYGCGDDVAVVAEEGPIATGIVAPLAVPGNAFAGYGAGPFGYGLGYGYDGLGLGYGGLGLGCGGLGLGYGGLGLGYGGLGLGYSGLGFGYGALGYGYGGLGLGYGNGYGCGAIY